MPEPDSVNRRRLPRGIVPVLQTPFTSVGEIDLESLERLIEDAIAAGAAGFLAPAVASEVETLSPDERIRLMRFLVERIGGRAPLIAGASAASADECARHVDAAAEAGADAYLVQVPAALYRTPEAICPFFGAIAARCPLPLVVQDLEWNGPGLTLDTMRALRSTIPTLAGFKIETVPAGPKYTAARQEFGPDMYIAGGWAVMQMIEALDRGVDAMIPEASMVRVYASIWREYDGGNREGATRTFRELLPILAYTNQEIGTSIAFFKALLVRRGIFRTEGMRRADFGWDRFNRRVAEDLIAVYLNLHAKFESEPSSRTH